MHFNEIHDYSSLTYTPLHSRPVYRFKRFTDTSFQTSNHLKSAINYRFSDKILYSKFYFVGENFPEVLENWCEFVVHHIH